MDIAKKLEVLTDAAKYDVACTSSGSSRKGNKGSLGSTEACGICHSFSADGRCISLLKILLTNSCIYDCKYCVNRRSNDVPRAAFTPDEIAELTMNFYRRNYIEGLFLSSAIIKNPDYTMELLYETLHLVRNKYNFNGYIHVKAIPGADKDIIFRTGLLADRMSVNIELPSEKSLETFAPDKKKQAILTPMASLKGAITQNKHEITLYKNAPKFVPAGQSTQMIIGASPESDKKIIRLAESLYHKYELRRVFYSAYMPVKNTHKLLPTNDAPLLREHRIYQADWLMRFYGFSSGEILENEDDNLDLSMDPKCNWAIRNLHLFPIEVNKASFEMLLRIPGVGVTGAKRIFDARKTAKLDFYNLKKLGIVLKRAKYFITCDGKMMEKTPFIPEYLKIRLTENGISEGYAQLSLFDNKPLIEKKEDVKCLAG